jgi:type IV secretion system protein VirB10
MSDQADPSERAPSLDDGRPVVGLPSGGPSLIVIVAGCAVLGLGLFAFLQGRRDHATPTPRANPQGEFAQLAPSAPPLRIPAPPPPPLPPPPPEPVIKYVDRPAPAPPPEVRYIERPEGAQPPSLQGGMIERSPEPAMVIDRTLPDDQAQTDDSAAHATVLHHRSLIVGQGTIIPAVLETPIDSTAPGPVRAITATDTRGFDGSRVLIPRGSRLYGQYQAGTQTGQARVLVTWTNLVRPDGISIRLNSPASDSRGGPGIPGLVNNHVFARVGAAAVETALVVGAALASRPGDGSVVIQSPVQSLSSAGQSLIPSPPGPTITVKEGADISVFVSRDLDFSGTLPAQ